MGKQSRLKRNRKRERVIDAMRNDILNRAEELKRSHQQALGAVHIGLIDSNGYVINRQNGSAP